MKFTRDDDGALHEALSLTGGGMALIVGGAENRSPVLFQLTLAERGVSVLLTRDEALKLSRLLQAATFVKKR